MEDVHTTVTYAHTHPCTHMHVCNHTCMRTHLFLHQLYMCMFFSYMCVFMYLHIQIYVICRLHTYTSSYFHSLHAHNYVHIFVINMCTISYPFRQTLPLKTASTASCKSEVEGCKSNSLKYSGNSPSSISPP